MRPILVALALIALCWGARFGWNAIAIAPAPVEPAALERSVAQDLHIEEQLRAGSAAPARGWLDAEDHLPFAGSAAAMNRSIDAFHAAGAERVWIVGIEEFGGSLVSDAIAAELPPSGAARERVLHVEASLRGGDAGADLGQRYVMVSFRN